MKAHIMRAYSQEHTYESRHVRAHIGEHAYESTEEESWSQNREAHCVGVCAVETHMDMSQKPLCVEN